jgi:hypothetical protein
LHQFDINKLGGDRLLLIDEFEEIKIFSQKCILDEARWLGKNLEGVIWAEEAKLHRIKDLCQGALCGL